MKKLFFLIFVSVILISCGSSVDKNSKVVEIPTVFRFSDMKYFMNFNTIVSDQKISPNIFTKIDSTNQYSFGFHCEMQKLHGGKASKVVVKTHYFFPNTGVASIVCSVTKKDSVVFWEAMKFNSSAGVKKWMDVEKEFDLKKTYSSDEQLSVYVWSPNGNRVYIEELEVTPKEQ
jgi:hypothetical protein